VGVPIYSLLLQIPGIDAPELTFGEQLSRNWVDTGWMRWPLLICLLIGLVVSVVKFYSLNEKSAKTKKIIKTVDELLAQRRVKEAMELTRESDAPAARILYAGLERHTEGTERVSKAIENQGLIEMSKLERGLIVLATVINVAPLLGFLGTVVGMILAFQAIEAAGEVEATLVAGGIKVALLTTAFGLLIAIPVSVFHNYFISKIDTLVIDMEESAQKLVETLHSIETGRG
jgi:biopolymer transport protein ExbB